MRDVLIRVFFILLVLTSGNLWGELLRQSGANTVVKKTVKPLVDKIDKGLSKEALATSATELPVQQTYLEAEEAYRDDDGVIRAQGGVILTSPNEQVKAEKMAYDEASSVIHACGDVVITTQQGDTIAGPEASFRRSDQTGFMLKPRYVFAARAAEGFLSGSGAAAELRFLGPQQYQFKQATYTVCPQDHPDWYVKVADLTINKAENVGEARQATIYFFDVPILYMPYLDFPLSKERKSGFLTPSIGSNGRRGLEFSLPYYWNIAPNYDATITPRLMTRRGLQLNTQVRYLHSSNQGEFLAEVLPKDQALHQNRHALIWRHQQDFNAWIPYLQGSWNLNRVSDSNYFVDLADRVSVTSQTVLPREGLLTWNQPLLGYYGGVSLRIQRFQTLQDEKAPISPPYERIPQISALYQRDDAYGFNWSVASEYVRFQHPTLVSADRTMVNPQIKWVYQTSGMHFIPKVGIHATNYDVQQSQVQPGFSATRTLPIASIDAGLNFERNFIWAGSNYLQTLEPRLFYVYIPYRSQEILPLFDTAVADFNFSQLFLENRFSGMDRINDANHLTTALVSRIVNSEQGHEQLRVALGQRFYFEQQRVRLGAPAEEIPPPAKKSDIVAAFSGRLTRDWRLDGGWQFNSSLQQQEKLSIAARYQPTLGTTLNLSYRYNRATYERFLGYSPLKQLDISTQWPLLRNWYAVARWNYSIQDRKIVDGLAGFEYLADCWALRLVAQRFNTTTQTTTNAFFIQLELNGLARLGSNPLESLKRNIPGYSKLNEPYRAESEGLPQAHWYEPSR